MILLLSNLSVYIFFLVAPSLQLKFGYIITEINQMIKNWKFFFSWIIVNPIGFMLGSLLGASNNGLIPILIPGLIGLMIGDLIFGAILGLTQWFVLRRTRALAVSNWWIIASSFGFMLGARLGNLLTHHLVNDWLPPSVIFGIFMGGSIGLATIWPLSQIIAWPRLFGWLAVSLPAWILGEGIAFASDFAHHTVPLIALIISGLTGLELLRLQAGETLKSNSW